MFDCVIWDIIDFLSYRKKTRQYLILNLDFWWTFFVKIVGGKCLVRNFWWKSFGGRMDSHYRSIALYSAATGFSQITMDFGWKAILDILQPRALPFFFSLPYTAYWSNKDKTVMVLQKGKIVDLIFHHFVRSSILKEGMFWSWRRPGLIKGKGAAIPPAVTSSHLKITTTKNLNFKVSHSLVRQKFLLRWYSSQLYSWRVLRVLDGWRIVAAPWPFQVSSSSSSSLTSPLRIERSAIEQRLSWAPPLLDYPPNTCQLSIEQRDNDISAKHCISLWAGIWGFQCASIRCTCPSKYIYIMAGGQEVLLFLWKICQICLNWLVGFQFIIS